MVRAEGVEPSRAVRPYGFSYRYGFRRPCRARPGLQSGLSLHRLPVSFRGLGAARLVSTPSRRKHSVWAWLGIAISGFPEFGQFYFASFPASTQNWLKSVASAIPPRPLANGNSRRQREGRQVESADAWVQIGGNRCEARRHSQACAGTADKRAAFVVLPGRERNINPRRFSSASSASRSCSPSSA